jgi:acyl carrier protein
MLLEIINRVLTNNDLQPISSLDHQIRFREDLDMDSIMLAELAVRIEDEYDIDIFENGMINTIGDILYYVENHDK